MIKATDPEPEKLTFKASPAFPLREIVLGRHPLCLLQGDGSGQERQLYHYRATSQTVDIHVALRTEEAERVERLLSQGKQEEAEYRRFCLRLASFGQRYGPEKRDRVEQRCLEFPRLPATRPYRDELAPLETATGDNPSREEPAGTDVKDALLYGAHPHANEIWNPADEAIRFILLMLEGEEKEGKLFVSRLEQRGRRDPQVGALLRQMKILAERMNFQFCSLTWHRIIKEIRNHLQPEEERWLRFCYLPNAETGQMTLGLDPFFGPLLQVQEFLTSAVKYIALGDTSERDAFRNLLQRYAFSYPGYAERVIQERREFFRRFRRFRKGDLGAPDTSPDNLGPRELDLDELLVGQDLPHVEEKNHLTARQHQVIQLRRQGLTQVQIGRALGISQAMVSCHLSNGIAKLSRRGR